MADRTCGHCGAAITTGRRDKKFCDTRCGKRFWDANNIDRKREHDQQFRDRHREALNARARQRHSENPDRARERQKKYAERRAAWWKTYQRDKIKKAASDRAYREANREQIAAYMLDYAAANRIRFREYGHRRSAAKRAAEGHATAEQIQARVDYYGGRCWMCGAPWEHIDHVKPLARGGCNWPANLRPACKSCNCSKKDRWPYVAA